MRIALHTHVKLDRIAEYEAAHREVPEALPGSPNCSTAATTTPHWERFPSSGSCEPWR
jgi:L-rhamnose mutarotase